VISLITPSLFLDILIGGLILGAIYSVIAAGLNLEYGVTRMLNVAHGDFLMLGAYLTYFSVTLLNMNPFASIIIVGPSMISIGLLVYALIFRRVVTLSRTAGELEFRSLLLFFGLSFVIQNLAMILWTANYRGYEAPTLGSVNVLGVTFEVNRIIIALISILINVFLYLFLRYTKVGLAMRATVDQPEGAQIVGINIYTIFAISFGIGVLLGGWSGILISILYSAINPFMGVPYTLIALVLVVLAGVGSFKGNIVGGFILGYLAYFTMRVIHSALTLVVIYAILILILLVRPRGLFVR
jgi:branched-chain amino acid transport system permease protein